LPLGEQIADVDAEIVVAGGVDDGCSQWAAQGEIVLDGQAPPRCHDPADCWSRQVVAAPDDDCHRICYGL
jgi:hypothetical protein